ncbi:hypothetical protein F5Y13DRAFT_184670 [Hypoxylon sp. FL1857]|nr:hypothetical protein F5Y13DRAFT_184670 [Hypoxylon sp. FL1857]
MASLPTIFFPTLLFIRLCAAEHPDVEAAVPADFPKAFITAMAVGIVSVVVLITLVCVLAHCWQYILGRRWDKFSREPETWVEPVFEWPQQLSRRPRNNRKRKRRQRQGRRELRNTASQEGMLGGWA